MSNENNQHSDRRIYVPETLLATASDTDEWAHEGHVPHPVFTQPNQPIEDVEAHPGWSDNGQEQSHLKRQRTVLHPVAEHGVTDLEPEYSDRAYPSSSEPYYLQHSKSLLRNQPSQRNVGSSYSPSQRSASVRFSYQPSLPLGQSLRRASSRQPRKGSIRSLYNRAELVNIKRQRRYWRRLLIEYGIYTILLGIVYFVLIGMPLWKGAVYWLYWIMQHKLVFQGGWAIFIALLVFYTFTPLAIVFEKDALRPEYYESRRISPAQTDTALLIPCYRSAPIISRTLEAALKIFPASHIYIIANGNSSSPLDDTEQICRAHGVNHIWAPVGSKIVALFIGCYAVKRFRHVLLIDDDCILPSNFPVVVSRLTEKVRCIGYTIKSVGEGSSPGSFCQQAQDLEYKLSGLQRMVAGRVGSAAFPHGAISLWERSFLKQTLHNHPGFSISEDWFLGNSCRRLGGRIQMCSAAFVETSTPSAVFFAGKSEKRGGFGELTVFKQRFHRWNFFVVNGLWHNLSYLVGSWKLGRWEFGTKIFIFQELYETVLYILTPFILPISLIVQSKFCIVLLTITLGLYMLHIVIFNAIHLRRKKEQVCWKVVLGYYMPYKLMIALTNVVACYWSLFKYARYFARRQPKLTEDHKAVGMVLKLEEMTQETSSTSGNLGRSLTVRAVSVQDTPVASAEGLAERHGCDSCRI